MPRVSSKSVATKVAPVVTAKKQPYSDKGMLMFELMRSIGVALVSGSPERYFVDIPDRAFDSAKRLMAHLDVWDKTSNKAVKAETQAILINPVEEYMASGGSLDE